MFKKRVLPVLLSLALTATAALPVVYAVESSGEAEAEQPVPQTVNFTNAGPFLPVTLAEEPGDGLELSKTVTLNDKDGYTINLEAYTTGTVTSVDTTKPVDIVLVLDASGSMSQNSFDGQFVNKEKKVTSNSGAWRSKGSLYLYVDSEKVKVEVERKRDRYTYTYTDPQSGKKYSYESQGSNNFPHVLSGKLYTTSWEYVKGQSYIEALKGAVNTFVNNVQKSAAGSDGVPSTDDDVYHRISIVKFSGKINRDWTDELKVGNDTYESGGYTWNYTQPMTDLLDMRQDENSTKIINAVNSIEPAGGTRSDCGMQVASKIMEEARSENDYDRNQVVIMFTDGEPTESNVFSDEVANDAILAAAEIKNYDKATVYTVGVFKGADGTVPDSPDDMNDWKYNKTNRYMHLVSSNFPDAKGYYHKNQWGDLNSSLEDGESYYLSASDSESLNDIFETISDNISASTVDLDEQTRIIDTVTPYFDMPKNVSDIKLYTQQAGPGGSFESTRPVEVTDRSITADMDGRKVTVTGFNFNEEFVTEEEKEPGSDDYGSKLIIEFNVTPTKDFFGGNNVPTNTSDSGVYAPDASRPTGTFDVPHANVPIKYAIDGKDQTIFLGEKADLAQTIDFVNEFKPNGTNNKYVKIVYTLTDPTTEDVIGTYTIEAGQAEGKWEWDSDHNPALTADKEYWLTCTVSPTVEKENACDVGPKQDNTAFSPNDPYDAPTVFVKSGTLTITKKMAAGTTADDGERFVFNIYKDAMSDPYMTVAVEAGKSVTINNLPAGTYTVEEDTSWSWRFESQLNNETVTINAKNPTAEITCTNSRANEQWLNKYDWAVNHQKDSGSVKSTGRSEAQ